MYTLALVLLLFAISGSMLSLAKDLNGAVSEILQSIAIT